MVTHGITVWQHLTKSVINVQKKFRFNRTNHPHLGTIQNHDTKWSAVLLQVKYLYRKSPLLQQNILVGISPLHYVFDKAAAMWSITYQTSTIFEKGHWTDGRGSIYWYKMPQVIWVNTSQVQRETYISYLCMHISYAGSGSKYVNIIISWLVYIQLFSTETDFGISLKWRHNGYMMSSQITSLTIVYSTIYSGTDQRKHQTSASLAFVWGIHWSPVHSPHKGPVTRKMISFNDVIMY